LNLPDGGPEDRLAGKIMTLLRISAFASAALAVILIVWFREPLSAVVSGTYDLLLESERFSEYVASYGSAAPLVFMGIQILQVIFAPIPGEATGVIGGYLFGAFKGCLYSTVALTVGSWINFGIGRFLGKRWVRKIVPGRHMAKFDHITRHQGVLVVFILFLIPGFPKDYLCLIIGVTTMPMRVFLILAGIGRIPGTLMLSLQGALVFEKNYVVFFVVVAINLLMVFLGYRYREALYRWVEKINGGPQQ
jgi:uncharacterized membrane protein YdjX (TVP38/TMEM64 family)